MSNAFVADNDIDYDLLNRCLAHAISEGDIVNFRFLFMPASPFRLDSPEDIHTSKYAYLLPENESSTRYQAALELTQNPEISRYVREQLAKAGPPQLPWRLVLALADNAVRLGKYTMASQAYELLRIRRRMQGLLLDQADARLRSGAMAAAVRGYLIASGLDYDYGAFPEPLPSVPNYQERALALHGVYPAGPEQSLATQPDAVTTKTALRFLLQNPDFSQRFEEQAADRVISFVAALIRGIDAHWEDFSARYGQAHAIVERHAELLGRINSYSPEALELLYEQLLDSEQMQELKQVPSILCGADCHDMEWWQILKTLAYHHPGAVLFVARQRLSAREEIIVPRCRKDSALAQALGLA